MFCFIIGLEPDKGFRCSIPQCDQDISEARVDDYGLGIFAIDSENGDINYCEQYPYKNLTGHAYCSSDDFDHNSPTVRCDPNTGNIKLIHASFAMDKTFATEFNLVCDNQYKVML